MIQLCFVPKNISQSWQTCSQYSHQTKPFKENPILKVSSPQNTRIVFHCLICVHSKYGNLNPNNKVTGEFFMSDIFRPTNFWRGKFYISKENPFVWEIFCWKNVKLWNKYLLPKNSHGVKGAEFKSFNLLYHDWFVLIIHFHNMV